MTKVRLSKKLFSPLSAALWNGVFMAVAISCFCIRSDGSFQGYVAVRGYVASTQLYSGETGFIRRPSYRTMPSFSYRVGDFEYNGLPLDIHRYRTQPNGSIRLYYNPLKPDQFVLSRRGMPKGWQVALSLTIAGIGVWTGWKRYASPK